MMKCVRYCGKDIKEYIPYFANYHFRTFLCCGNNINDSHNQDSKEVVEGG